MRYTITKGGKFFYSSQAWRIEFADNRLQGVLHMIRFLLIVLAAASVSYAQMSFYPMPDDTAVISFDPLHLATKGGSSASFTCSWAAPALHKDSISWLIDGVVPLATDAFILNAPNPRDLPPEYCLGSTMSILQQADPRYFQGIHKIDLTIKFTDSTKKATWFFEYQATKYKEIRARLIIDSFWTTYSSNDGWRNFTKYEIAGAEKFDTALFGNAFYGGDFSSIENDTVGIMREYISQKTGAAPAVPKDTVDCFVVQILWGDPARNEWLVSDSIGSFLRIANAPFPLDAALGSFNEYLYNHGLYRGYTPPPGDLKIGPVFKFTQGDPGWRVRAFHDAEFWYVDFLTGYGDCPCGCTEWRSDRYKIKASGAVESLFLPILNPAHCPAERSTGGQYIYSLQGRRVGSQKCLAKLGKGAYIAPHPGKERLITQVRE
jgi:hypothetical protein